MISQAGKPTALKIFALATLMVHCASSGVPAFASDRCPLSNPAYKDIRAASAKLQEKLALAPGCEKIEEELKSVGTGIKSAVDALYTADAERQKSAGEVITADAKKDAEEARIKLKAAVDGVQSLSSIVAKYTMDPGSSCGKSLSGNLEFMEAFVETVNGLAPFALLYGGSSAAPLVLGASAVTALGKTFISMFKNKGPDMGDPKQRQLFIENACAYYMFNENYEALQKRDEQIQSAQASIAQLERELAELEQRGKPPFAPGLEVFGEIDGYVRTSTALFKSFAEVADRMPGVSKDTFTCSYVRGRIKEGIAAKASSYFGHLLELPAPVAVSKLADEQLLTVFREESNPDSFELDLAQPRKCADRARYWLELYKVVLERMENELARPGRRDQAMTNIRKWESQKEHKTAALKGELDRLVWLKTLVETGESIETSEISQARDDSRDALFATTSRRALFNLISVDRQSPAELWLKNKNDSANKKISEYKWMRTPVFSRWLEAYPDPSVPAFVSSPLKAEGCAEVKAAVLSWMTARSHVEAANTFCTSFRYSVVEQLHGETSAYCFGRNKRFSGEREESINQETERRVSRYNDEVARLGAWLKAASCPLPKRIDLPKTS